MRRSLPVFCSVLAIAIMVSYANGEERPPRIGIYDSRVVAYAYFSSEAFQEKLQKQMAEAKKVEQSGDKEKIEKLKKGFQEGQRQIHRQVFSTAPIDNILEEIKDRLPKIQQEAGVSLLISQWDKEKLANHASAEKVDVTERLIDEFKPTEKQLKMIESIKKTKPVSLEEADQCK